MYPDQNTWCCKEFSSVKLGDRRLNRRLLSVASALLKHPDEPIHIACSGWASAKAAYRLFDNQKMEETALLQVHQLETIKRLEEQDKAI